MLGQTLQVIAAVLVAKGRIAAATCRIMLDSLCSKTGPGMSPKLPLPFTGRVSASRRDWLRPAAKLGRLVLGQSVRSEHSDVFRTEVQFGSVQFTHVLCRGVISVSDWGQAVVKRGPKKLKFEA